MKMDDLGGTSISGNLPPRVFMLHLSKWSTTQVAHPGLGAMVDCDIVASRNQKEELLSKNMFDVCV